jgi:hypothetical protein
MADVRATLQTFACGERETDATTANASLSRRPQADVYMR